MFGGFSTWNYLFRERVNKIIGGNTVINTTGANVYNVSGNTIFQFDGRSGSVSFSNVSGVIPVSILAIGGGGGGGSGLRSGGGGGGGGVFERTANLTASTTARIVTGDGGVGGSMSNTSNPNSAGSNGGNTTVTFSSQTTQTNVIAYGGGGGGKDYGPGSSGGSGGGAGYFNGFRGTANTNNSNLASSGGKYISGSGSAGGGGATEQGKDAVSAVIGNVPQGYDDYATFVGSTYFSNGTSAYSPTTNKIYVFPRNAANTILVHDVDTNTSSTITISETRAYYSAVYSPNNKYIYLEAITGTTSGLMVVFNPATNAVVTTFSLTKSVSGKHWNKGVYVSHNQSICYMPHIGNTILVVNTLTNTVSYYATDGLIRNESILVSSQNEVYALPGLNTSYVLIFNTLTTSINTTDISFNSSIQLTTGIFAKNSIYCVDPTVGTYIINPTTRTYTSPTSLNFNTTFFVLLPSSSVYSSYDESIYISDGNNTGSRNILVIDTKTNTFFYKSFDSIVTHGYQNAIITNNLSLYFVPNSDSGATGNRLFYIGMKYGTVSGDTKPNGGLGYISNIMGQPFYYGGGGGGGINSLEMVGAIGYTLSADLVSPTISNPGPSVYVPYLNRIYGLSSSNNNAYYLDVSTNTLNTFTLSNSFSQGSVYDPNLGVIFSTLSEVDVTGRILRVTPLDNTSAVASTYAKINSNASPYLDGVYIPSLRSICYIPYNESRIMIYNPNNNTTTFYSIGASNTNRTGAIFSPLTNEVYSLPTNTTTRVMTFNVVTNVIDLSAINIGISLRCGVVGANGLIYCMTDGTSAMVVINPVNKTFTQPGTLNVNTDNNFVTATSGVLSKYNNRIYYPSSLGNKSRIAVVDPSTNTYTTINLTSASTNGFINAITVNNYSIYMTPNSASGTTNKYALVAMNYGTITGIDTGDAGYGGYGGGGGGAAQNRQGGIGGILREAILDYTNFGQNLSYPTISPADESPADDVDIASIAMDYTGRIQKIMNRNYDGVFENTLYTSFDYGNTFSAQVSMIISVYGGRCVAMSADGKYTLAILYYYYGPSNRAYRLAVSNRNYGINIGDWDFISDNNWIWCAISSSGQYMIAVRNTVINMSSTYGTNWYQVGASLGALNFIYVAMSSSGQYITVVTPSSIHISSNYGASWPITITTITNISQVSMSGTGQYQSVSTSSTIYYSHNYGLPDTWYPSTVSDNFVSVCVSNTGKYQLAGSAGNSRLYRSTDFGVTWNYNLYTSFYPKSYRALAMSYDKALLFETYDAEYITIGSNIFVDAQRSDNYLRASLPRISFPQANGIYPGKTGGNVVVTPVYRGGNGGAGTGGGGGGGAGYNNIIPTANFVAYGEVSGNWIYSNDYPPIESLPPNFPQRSIFYASNQYNYIIFGQPNTYMFNSGTYELWFTQRRNITVTRAAGRFPLLIGKFGAFQIELDADTTQNRVCAIHYSSGNREIGITADISMSLSWNHVALSFVNNGTSTLYVNGIPRGTMTQTIYSNNLSPVTIGSSVNRPSRISFANVRIWNYNRSAADISNNRFKLLGIGDASGLVGSFLMNDVSMQNYALVGGGYGGYGTTIISIPTATIKEFVYYCIEFSGNTYIKIPLDNTTYGPVLFTAEAWIKTPPYTGTTGIFGISNANNGYGLLNINNVLHIQWGATIQSTEFTIGDNAWHHVAIVTYGNRIGAFVDNVASTNFINTFETTADSAVSFGIGVLRYDATTEYIYTGKMYNFRLWNYTRTSFVDIFDTIGKPTIGLIMSIPFNEAPQTTNAYNYAVTPPDSINFTGTNYAWVTDAASPSNLTFTNITTTTISVSYSSIYPATQYEVIAKNAKTNQLEQTIITSDLSCTLTGLNTLSNTYSILVAGIDINGGKTPQTKLNTLAAVNGINVTSTENTRIFFEFIANQYANIYETYTVPTTTTRSVTPKNASVYDLDPNTTYTIYIVARNTVNGERSAPMEIPDLRKRNPVYYYKFHNGDFVENKGIVDYAKDNSGVYTQWTNATSLNTGNWQSITWNSNTFIAVSSSGDSANRIATSNNGINWTASLPANTNYNWTSVCSVPSTQTAVAVASNHRIGKTTDGGINWTSVDVSGNWSKVIWSPEQNIFVATSIEPTNTNLLLKYNFDDASGTYIANTANPNGPIYDATLVNGATLTTNPSHVKVGISALTLSKNLSQYAILPSFTTNNSEDGLTISLWFNHDSNEPYTCVFDFGNGANNDNILYSVNAGAIFYVNDISYNLNINAVKNTSKNIWHHLVWIIPYANPGMNAEHVVYFDGIRYTNTNLTPNRLTRNNNFIGKSNLPTDPAYLTGFVDDFRTYNRKLTHEEALYLYSLKSISTSTDGITWTPRNAPPANWKSVCWSAEQSLFVAVTDYGQNYERVATSSDGITWTMQPLPFTTQVAWKSVIWVKELSIFVAVGGSGVMTSPNGITWTLVPEFNNNNTWTTINWSNTYRVLVALANPSTTSGTSGMYSYNGTQWNYIPSLPQYGWKEIAWSNTLERFAAVAESGANRATYSTTTVDASFATSVTYSINTFVNNQYNPINNSGSIVDGTNYIFNAIRNYNTSTIMTGINNFTNTVVGISAVGVNGSLQLNKSLRNHLVTPNFATSVDTSGLSITFWVKCNTDASNCTIFDFATNNTGTNRISAIIVNGKPRLVVDATTAEINQSITTNTWNHIAWTIFTDGTWRAYLNGLYIGIIGTGLPTNVERTLNYIGRSVTDLSATNTANIYLDDFRVWNTTLTNTTATLLYYGSSPNTAYDPSGLYLGNPTDTTATLYFTKNASAAYYEARTYPETTVSRSVTQPFVNLSGLSANIANNYTVYLTAYNINNLRSNQVSVSFLPRISNLEIASTTDVSANIKYTSPNEVNRVVIYTSPTTSVVETNDLSAVTLQLPINTNIVYSVYAYALNTTTNAVSLASQITFLPSTANVVASFITETSALLEFINIPNATSYEIYTSPTTSVQTTNTNNRLFTGLSAGINYTFYIVAVNSATKQRSLAKTYTFATFQNTVYYYKFDSVDYDPNTRNIANYKNTNGIGTDASGIGGDNAIFDASAVITLNNAELIPAEGINTQPFVYNTSTPGQQFRNGTYDVSASSYKTNAPNFLWGAFDNSSSTLWSSDANTYSDGNYIGSATTTLANGGGTIAGEWLQLKFPYQGKMVAYTISGESATVDAMPKVVYILGSNTGNTWENIDFLDIANPISEIKKTQGTLTNNKYYNQFRVVANKNFGNNSVSFGKWDITIEPQPIPVNSNIFKFGNAALSLQYGATATNSFVQLPTFTVGSNGICISLWINIAETNATIADLLNETQTDIISIRVNNNNPLFFILQNNITTQYTAPVSVVNNGWNHILWNILGNGTWITIVNGITYNANITTYPNTTTRTKNFIGRNVSANTNSNFYLDEFRLWNAPISGAQSDLLFYRTTIIYNVANTIAFAASVRVFVATYNGPVVQLRRSNDGALQNFYTDATQSFFTTAANGNGTSLNDWLGNNNGHIKVWYNQNGNGIHARNAEDNATQPILELKDGKYVVKWIKNNNTYLQIDQPIPCNTVFSQFLNTNTIHGSIAAQANTSGSIVTDLGARFGSSGANSVNGDSNSDDWYYNGSGTKLAYVNGNATNTLGTIGTWKSVALSTTISATSPNAAGFRFIGADGLSTPGRGIDGYMSEFILHNRPMLAENMVDFYINRISNT